MCEELVLMETELNLIKKQTKQTPYKTQTLGTLCEWAHTKLICSYPSTPEERDKKCLKGEIFHCFVNIFTQLCAGSKEVQPAFLLLVKSQEVSFFFPFLSPPVSLLCQAD